MFSHPDKTCNSRALSGLPLRSCTKSTSINEIHGFKVRFRRAHKELTRKRHAGVGVILAKAPTLAWTYPQRPVCLSVESGIYSVTICSFTSLFGIYCPKFEGKFCSM